MIYFGLVGSLVYWSFVLWSIAMNPWFSFWNNALSDLGAEKANDPWIYNIGLIIASPFVIVFSYYLISISENKMQAGGSLYMGISAIFLALIGVFHGGTRYHSLVTKCFFIQFFLGAIIFGMSTIGCMRIATLVIIILMVLGVFVVWPSVAMVETYYISLIMLFNIFVIMFLSKMNE